MDGKPSTGAKITLPKWASVLFRILGVVNAVIALIGMIWEIQSAHFFLVKYSDPFRPSSFQVVFAAMTLANLGFVTVLFVTAIRFIQANVSVANLYSVAVLILFVYGMAIRVLWHVGGGIGMSVAGATGVGNMGIAPFEFLFVLPYLYPFLSLGFVQALKHHYGTAQIRVSA